MDPLRYVGALLRRGIYAQNLDSRGDVALVLSINLIRLA